MKFKSNYKKLISCILLIFFLWKKPALGNEANFNQNPTKQKLIENTTPNLIILKFKEYPQLVKITVRLSPEVQNTNQKLILNLAKKNLTNQIIVEPVDGLKNVFTARNNGNDGIIFFRKNNEILEILGQGSSEMESKVVSLLKSYGY